MRPSALNVGCQLRRRRVGTVVVRNELDLAAVDSAIIVDHIEISRFGFSSRPERGQRAGVRHDVSDTDLGIAHAAVRNQIGIGESGPENDRHNQWYRTFSLSEPTHWSISVRYAPKPRFRRSCAHP